MVLDFFGSEIHDLDRVYEVGFGGIGRKLP